MKPFIITTTSGALILLSSCSYLGLHTSKQLQNKNRSAYSSGLEAGKALAARANYLRQQEELAKPQPKATYYNIPVPDHTSVDGVRFNSHTKNIQIITK